jgi:hypothetical protein
MRSKRDTGHAGGAREKLFLLAAKPDFSFLLIAGFHRATSPEGGPDVRDVAHQGSGRSALWLIAKKQGKGCPSGLHKRDPGKPRRGLGSDPTPQTQPPPAYRPSGREAGPFSFKI